MPILVTLIVLLWFAHASATPLTTGSLFTGGIVDFGPLLTASGPDLSVSTSATQGTVTKNDAPSGFSTPFGTGTLATLNSTALVTGGTAVLGSQTHPLVQQPPGALSFTTGSFALPTVSQNTSVTLPFTMTGTLQLDMPGNDLTLLLTGAGFATGTFVTGGTSSLFLSAVRYDFLDIPEPSSVLLVGSGIAGLFWRYRKK